MCATWLISAAGGLLDIGCYPITVARYIFGAEPIAVTGTFDRDPKFKTDRVMGAFVISARGGILSFSISTQLAPYQRVHILGTKGRIEIEIPFNAPPDKPTRIFVQGMEMNEGVWHEFAVADQYQLQGEAFGKHVRSGKPLVWGVDDALANMAVIDALFKSEKTGKWERVQ